MAPHTLIHNESVCVSKPSPRVPSISPLVHTSNQKNQPALAIAKLKLNNNVFSTVNPFHQGEGGERLSSAPCRPVIRGDQELQGGGAYPETRGATAVAATPETTRDAGSVHTSDPVPATEAGCSNITIATTVLTS